MIYLDHAATTPVSPEVAQVAYTAMVEGYGNPSSRYPLGKAAAQRRDQDRRTVAKALGCRPEELYFTSCGTESDNWAIYGAVERNHRRGRHMVTTAIEHSAVIEPMKHLERKGFEVTWLQPDAQGQISPEDIRKAIRPDTILVSMMLVNNELGTILPVAEVGKAVRAAGSPALVHCDGVQGFMKIPFTPKQLGVDLLSISGHKIGAPKGIGALYVRKELQNWKPLMQGGGQESGFRPGTEATAQIAAFAKATEMAQAGMKEDALHMQALKSYLLQSLAEKVPEVQPLGQGQAPHIQCLTLDGYKSEVLVRVLGDRGICVSAGSACHRGKPSHVFDALPVEKSKKEGAFRVSFGKENTTDDVDQLVMALREGVDRLFPSLSGKRKR